MARGFVYLVAVIDCYSRRVLAWRLSNTLETTFCVEAVNEAVARYDCPEIFNTDQGSQFTAEDFTTPLLNRGIKISMDGKGRCIDNIFVERPWRSLKYEEVYVFNPTGSTLARSHFGLENGVHLIMPPTSAQDSHHENQWPIKD